jgi:hypothetical protein
VLGSEPLEQSAVNSGQISSCWHGIAILAHIKVVVNAIMVYFRKNLVPQQKIPLERD